MLAAQLTYYRQPTTGELRRIKRAWNRTQEGKRHVVGTQVERLATYFDASLFNAQLRVDSLASRSLSARQLQHRKKRIAKGTSTLRRDWCIPCAQATFKTTLSGLFIFCILLHAV
jgi:hypothetical protein